MRVAVILSTYNAPRHLERVLLGYGVQDHRPAEVVVADDGSGPETRELIARLDQEMELPVRHVWHEDRGFRKCAILNRAIAATDADYLLFSDGDCIPRRDFVGLHARLARPGRFLSGGYFKLPRRVSEAIAPGDVLAGRATDPGFLRKHGLPWSPKVAMRLAAGPLAARLLDVLTPTRATWNGHNASGWRADVLRANGFDERMRYGGEDRELGERLVHAGLEGVQVRHRAVCVHLWHERGYDRPEDLEANRAIRRETARLRRRVTPHGIVPGGPGNDLPLPGGRIAGAGGRSRARFP